MPNVLFRPIRKATSGHPKWTLIADEVKKTIDDVVKPRVLEYHQNIVAPWDHPPEFKAAKFVTKEGITVRVWAVGPNKKYWIWVTEGTKPPKKDIVPKKPGGVLAFPANYKPHTTVRGPGYKGPGTSSGPMVFVKRIKKENIKGIKARPFIPAIARWSKTWFAREMKNAIARGKRKAK